MSETWEMSYGKLAERAEQLEHDLLVSETEHVRHLLSYLSPYWDQHSATRTSERAAKWITALRQSSELHGFEAFMREYDLSSEEGVVLMCLAEALLRIPDNDVAQKLISSKLQLADWHRHIGKSHSLFVNASTWGLLFSGKLLRNHTFNTQGLTAKFTSMLSRTGEPLVRNALKTAMRFMASQFVMGEGIDSAIRRAETENRICSFDMLGEAAITAADAERYFLAYLQAIHVTGSATKDNVTLSGHNISIKLSALHPRYEVRKHQRVLNELVAKVTQLAACAASYDLALTIDAEEVDRLELSLEVFMRVRLDASLSGWSGLGLAVQAYQKRALAVLQWLHVWVSEQEFVVPVRLVKGAYWDAEIKKAQEQGLSEYPVFTRKQNTDLSYMVCGHFLLQHTDCFYPMFATHNAHTLSAIQSMAQHGVPLEVQRLHGMGGPLHDEFVSQWSVLSRVYAPVGQHEDLLPYLVRRMLENGANTSFVNRLEDEGIPVDQLVVDPVTAIRARGEDGLRNRSIPLPMNLFGKLRDNSSGYPLFARSQFNGWYELLSKSKAPYTVASIVNGKVMRQGEVRAAYEPSNLSSKFADSIQAMPEQLAEALDVALSEFDSWNAIALQQRANTIMEVGDVLQRNADKLIPLLVREAGRTLDDAVSELREAVDFCRYYAGQILEHAQPVVLPGPTGELNMLHMSGRGVFVCISPWNFPLAIFTGQIVAALAAGNVVLAKPASQTPVIAFETVRLMYEAGIPREALQLLICSGSMLSDVILTDARIAGVAFTGSTETAYAINRVLAKRNGPLACLIAETGGLNAMIADSSALPEQVVRDAIMSAFNSAGQRCSALRVLYVQREIADRVLELLVGAMDELEIGSPGIHSIDIGPLIDRAAVSNVLLHVEKMNARGKVVKQVSIDQKIQGHWCGPVVIELDSIAELEQEVFGPVLHVVRYGSEEVEQVVKDINAAGYGLTLGIHSRVDMTIEFIIRHARVGNIYVNRNMVGAVVGVQPFGGQGLSGTGPKAGGPHYLQRFMTEKTVAVNTSAIGGNTALLTIDD